MVSELREVLLRLWVAALCPPVKPLVLVDACSGRPMRMDVDEVVREWCRGDDVYAHLADPMMALDLDFETNELSPGIVEAVSSFLVDQDLAPVSWYSGTGINRHLVCRCHSKAHVDELVAELVRRWPELVGRRKHSLRPLGVPSPKPNSTGPRLVEGQSLVEVLKRSCPPGADNTRTYGSTEPVRGRNRCERLEMAADGRSSRAFRDNIFSGRVAQLAVTPEGGRNNALAVLGRDVGKYEASGELTAEDAAALHAEIEAAALASGLPSAEVDKTLNATISHGYGNPELCSHRRVVAAFVKLALLSPPDGAPKSWHRCVIGLGRHLWTRNPHEPFILATRTLAELSGCSPTTAGSILSAAVDGGLLEVVGDRDRGDAARFKIGESVMLSLEELHERVRELTDFADQVLWSPTLDPAADIWAAGQCGGAVLGSAWTVFLAVHLAGGDNITPDTVVEMWSEQLHANSAEPASVRRAVRSKLRDLAGARLVTVAGDMSVSSVELHGEHIAILARERGIALIGEQRRRRHGHAREQRVAAHWPGSTRPSSAASVTRMGASWEQTFQEIMAAAGFTCSRRELDTSLPTFPNVPTSSGTTNPEDDKPTPAPTPQAGRLSDPGALPVGVDPREVSPPGRGQHPTTPFGPTPGAAEAPTADSVGSDPPSRGSVLTAEQVSEALQDGVARAFPRTGAAGTNPRGGWRHYRRTASTSGEVWVLVDSRSPAEVVLAEVAP